MKLTFETDTGIFVRAVTAVQMREVDRIAVEESGPNLYQMMENAGRNLATLATETLGERWGAARIVVIAGTGGNGGGGTCAARHLANRGAQVSLCLARPAHLAGVPAWQYQIFRSTDGRAVDASALGGESADFILDALIGYGLEAAPRGVYADVIEWANETAAPILSLDVPSGIDSTTGTAPGEFAHAYATMTLALPKTALVPEKTGRLVLADLGIPVDTYRRLGLDFAPPFDYRYLVPLQAHYTEDQ